MFSNSTKYGIRTIIYLSSLDEGNKSTVAEIAESLDLPRPYLSKLLQQLSKSGIISSTKGRGGGFYLSTQNLDRPLIDIVECIEGHNVFKKCILGLPLCNDKNPCHLHCHYKQFKSELENTMMKESVRELLKDSKLRRINF